MRKMTKLFLIHGSKPPIWPVAKNEAKRFWMARALFHAKIEAEFMIDEFAEELLHFSASVAGTPRGTFPFDDAGCNDYVSSFFSTLWVPGLRSRLTNLTSEQFSTFVLAAARLLGAMGYGVSPVTHSNLPPGTGEKQDSDHFPKPFDVV
jgi:hypothetical protein